uniref:single-stranded-DNA-specific exonuclease RecJ n=1 Tax=Parasutterella excrementihominis TaxID=487175 RepID=UPI003FEF1B07
MTKITIRRFDRNVVQALTNRGFLEPLARALAARHVTSPSDLDYEFKEMLSPWDLKNCREAGEAIADAIWKQKKIVIIGDYDCDGATAVSVGILGLQALGAFNVSYLIPDRDKDGYGLSPQLVDRAAAAGAELIITVDNGISSVAAVEHAKTLGIEAVVTDHHLPGDEIPDTLVVNPNQRGDTFPSKSLAGVGVIFYVLIAVRSALRAKGAYPNGKQPNLQHLIDLVALGTVADVVPLDRNNRILVSKGLDSIRAGKMQPGVSALLSVAGKNAHRISANDLGYILGPRINAAGRLDSINKGVECLTSYDYNTALFYAKELDQINAERRNREVSMQSDAILSLQTISVDDSNSIVLKGDDWHAGIIGLVASRIKEQTYRPVIAFAPSEENGEHVLKGSGRSIPGIHLRDALDRVSKLSPGLILKFGGHAMAAGLTIRKDAFDEFKELFARAVKELSDPEMFERNIVTDGELRASDFNIELVEAIRKHVWGQAFPEPLFANQFKVLSQRVLKDQHLKLSLEVDGREIQAIWFRHKRELPPTVRLAYKLDINDFRGRQSVQLIIEGMEDEFEDWTA